MRLPGGARKESHNNASGSVQDERAVQPIRSIRILLSGGPLTFAQSAYGPRSNRLRRAARLLSPAAALVCLVALSAASGCGHERTVY